MFVESLAYSMRGRVNFTDLINRPFQELRELYRISFLREEARAAAEKIQQEEEKKREEAEKRKNRNSTPQSRPQIHKQEAPVSSQMDEYDLEEALEEMAGGGIM